MPVPDAVTEKDVLPFGQIVELEGPTDIEGTVLKFRVAVDEVTAGLQVPATTHLYW